MNTIDKRKRILERFLFAVRPRAMWANRAVAQYLWESALWVEKGLLPFTPEKWIRWRGLSGKPSRRTPSAQRKKSFFRSLEFARFCLELREVPSREGKIAYTL